MEEIRERIIKVFTEAAHDYLNKRVIVSYEIDNGHDVHAFYRVMANPDGVIHVQGYPGMSNEKIMWISARARNYYKMLLERVKGHVSVGNEHKSNLPFFGNAGLQLGKGIPYSAKALQDILAREFSGSTEALEITNEKMLSE